MIPCSCAASSASAICFAMGNASSSGIAPRAMRCDRSSPSTSSITIARTPPTLFEAVDVRDVRVIEGRQRLRFACEPRQPVGVAGERVGQDLQRDVAIELGIARAEHLAHPAGADAGDDFVDAEARTGSERQPAGSIAVSGLRAGRRRLLRRYQALQLLQPVLNDDDAGRSSGWAGAAGVFDHQKTLAVRRHIICPRPDDSRKQGSSKELPIKHCGRRGRPPRRTRFNTHAHERAVWPPIKELLAVPRPERFNAPTSRHLPVSAIHVRKRAYLKSDAARSRWTGTPANGHLVRSRRYPRRTAFGLTAARGGPCPT